jgi:hypothetical protein
MYGQVLEGGGARGAYQLGACKALSILLLEEVANRYQVDRFKIYTLEEFLAAIKARYTPHRGRVRMELPDLLRRGRLAPLLAREEIFDEVVYQVFEEIR